MRITIILVAPARAENIGAAARAMKPMIQSRKIKELKTFLGINVLKSYTKNQ